MRRARRAGRVRSEVLPCPIAQTRPSSPAQLLRRRGKGLRSRPPGRLDRQSPTTPRRQPPPVHFPRTLAVLGHWRATLFPPGPFWNCSPRRLHWRIPPSPPPPAPPPFLQSLDLSRAEP